MERKRVAILVSGRGSNMAALIDAARDPAYPAGIALVLSSKAGAAALARATEAGIPAEPLDYTSFPGKPEFEAALEARLESAAVDLVCLAGFMRLLSEGFVDRWHDRLINIHPSLLPAFTGLNTHARALDAGVRLHGCTVHYVRAAMDNGPIVAQAAVPVLSGDTPDRLAARVLAAEHRLYPLALSLVASGRARVVGGTVVMDPPHDDDGAAMLMSPAGEGYPTTLIHTRLS